MRWKSVSPLQTRVVDSNSTYREVVPVILLLRVRLSSPRKIEAQPCVDLVRIRDSLGTVIIVHFLCFTLLLVIRSCLMVQNFESQPFSSGFSVCKLPASQYMPSPISLAFLTSFNNSSFVPHFVARPPFWSNSPKSYRS